MRKKKCSLFYGHPLINQSDFPLPHSQSGEKNWAPQGKRKMTYYFDSCVPVCSYEWRHERKTIQKDFLKINALF